MMGQSNDARRVSRGVLLLLFAALLNLASRNVNGKHYNTYAGPYNWIASRIYGCGKDGCFENSDIKFFLRLSHFNPTRPKDPQLVNGNTTVLKSLDNSYWITVIVDQRNNNQWKENAFVFNFRKSACDIFFKYAPTYSKAVFGTLEEENPCAVKQGINMVTNAPLRFAFPMVPIMPYMHARVRVTLNEIGNATPSACFMLDSQTIPK